MKRIHARLGVAILFGILVITTNAFAEDFTHSMVGAGGYDVVAYHTQSKALRGTGFHAAQYDGVTYLFVSGKNKDLFLKNPGQYLPQFGGFCAFGAAKGKKIYADPTVWKLVDGKLYLNVDAKIQKKFVSDLSGNIAKAEANWPELVNQTPEGL
ncbi:MAG: YHS domain-containing (seleno)protein [Desulfosarcinaceae bacterium]|jgi:YHS domain-containing protein